MNDKGVALAVTGTGAVFLWAGIKGYSVTQVIQDLVTGKAPVAPSASLAFSVASPTTGTPGSTIAGSGSPATGPAVTGSGSVGQFQQYAFSLFPQYGWGADQQQPLINLWNQESGWDPTAYNPSRHTTNPDDSHAFGIPQSLPASKMASAGPDWRTNGFTQIRWGLGYIHSAYGNPAGAWAHEQAYSWY